MVSEPPLPVRLHRILLDLCLPVYCCLTGVWRNSGGWFDFISSAASIFEPLEICGHPPLLGFEKLAGSIMDNRNPSKRIPHFKVENQNDVVEIEMEEVDDVIVTWGGYSLVGYVASCFLGIDAITRMRNSWKIPNKFNIHKSWWLVFRFDEEENRQRVLDGGTYMIYGRHLILKNMPPLFEFGAYTNSILPVWVMLPGFLVAIWNAQVLAKICSKISDPLWTNALTGKGIGRQISKQIVSLNQRCREQHNRQNSGVIQTDTAGNMGTNSGLNQGQNI
ncbi:hypothetical protein M9H77_12695 [Catharanthus roseus]|uniref:Uncharacterized protein n=1 Tax=Catharanthus roseus TaxID=4058 RepID=A0ACC0BI48_CATRO|nr:hypothetical protein M9H77_12695 [Catharanthus roseus]